MSLFTTQTYHLISDYISWRLVKEDYQQIDEINLKNLIKNNELNLCLIMRQTAYEFELRYNQEYLPLANQFDILDINYKEILKTLINELFQTTSENEDKKKDFFCNWGRIIALFSFSGCLTVKLCQNNRQNLIFKLIDELCKYLTTEQKIVEWLEQNNYWEGFIESFNNSEKILKKEEYSIKNQISINLNKESNNKLLRLSQFVGFSMATLSLALLGYLYFKRLK